MCLAAALCSFRLPGFIALNEPESSLHEELIAPLAAMIVKAASSAQIVVVTHSTRLASILEAHGEARWIALEKENGATVPLTTAAQRMAI